jgi:hypothetical protein
MAPLPHLDPSLKPFAASTLLFPVCSFFLSQPNPAPRRFLSPSPAPRGPVLLLKPIPQVNLGSISGLSLAYLFTFTSSLPLPSPVSPEVPLIGSTFLLKNIKKSWPVRLNVLLIECHQKLVPVRVLTNSQRQGSELCRPI